MRLNKLSNQPRFVFVKNRIFKFDSCICVCVWYSVEETRVFLCTSSARVNYRLISSVPRQGSSRVRDERLYNDPPSLQLCSSALSRSSVTLPYSPIIVCVLFI